MGDVFPRSDSDVVGRTKDIWQEQLEVAGIRRGPCSDVGIATIGGLVQTEGDGRGVVGIDGCSRPLSTEGRKLRLRESFVKLEGSLHSEATDV